MYDRPRSLAAAAKVTTEPKACFRNALLAFLTIDELHDGRYVEGFAVPEIKGFRLPVEHGWVTLPDGTIIDVSYVMLEPASVSYFPVLQLTQTQALRLVDPEVRLPRMLRQRSPRNRQAYLTAQEAAHRAAFGAASPL